MVGPAVSEPPFGGQRAVPISQLRGASEMRFSLGAHAICSSFIRDTSQMSSEFFEARLSRMHLRRVARLLPRGHGGVAHRWACAFACLCARVCLCAFGVRLHARARERGSAHAVCVCVCVCARGCLMSTQVDARHDSVAGETAFMVGEELQYQSSTTMQWARPLLAPSCLPPGSILSPSCLLPVSFLSPSCPSWLPPGSPHLICLLANAVS